MFAFRGRLVCVPLVLVVACSSESSAPPPFGDDGGTGGDDAGADATKCDVLSDPNNCGTCGNACTPGDACCGGICVETASCAFAVTRVSATQGWQNGGTWVDLTGAGFAKGMKARVGAGRAPVRVVDATHATLLTPPGPVGFADVSVELSGQTAALRQAFLYKAGGLTNQWIEVTMSVARGEEPALALLRDGHVLVSGGSTNEDISTSTQATGEIFDRPTQTFSPAKGSMSVARWWNSAVTLLDGKVLVVGNACNYGPPYPAYCSDPKAPLEADLFDPSTGSYAPTPSPTNKSRGLTLASLLPDGRVIVASAGEPSVEIYDPDSGAFQLVPHPIVHGFGFMTRLRDGRVLIGGGADGTPPSATTTSAETFDADTNTFTTVGPLQKTRYIPAAVALPDGSALVIGGDPTGDVIERFDPQANAFSATPYKLAVGRAEEAAVLVRDGTVLVVGGILASGGCNTTTSVEQIDPVKQTVTKFPDRPSSSTELSGITLADGSVLVAGGVKCQPGSGGPNSNFVEFLAGASGNQ